MRMVLIILGCIASFVLVLISTLELIGKFEKKKGLIPLEPKFKDK